MKISRQAGKSYTRPVARAALVNQGNVVRNNFNHYDCFHGDWWGQYPGVWRAAAWTTAAVVWRNAAWNTCAAFCSCPAEPIYYDYGTNVVYEGETVDGNGDSAGTQEQYAEQAITLADTGKKAEPARMMSGCRSASSPWCRAKA